jgi:1-acyl-sn-glycerol-3-phosphate acyltransferase
VSVLDTLVRRVGAIALEWFYRDVEVVGRERIPREGPLLLAVNHPNQLADVLAVMRVVPRRVRFTAKATFFEVPVLGALFRAYGVVPLRRAKDEGVASSPEAPVDPARNAEAFRAVVETLAEGEAVLIFPEGISHGAPQLAPLRSGVARLALQARAAGVRGLKILPIGLVFERKWAPRTRILVTVGEPLAMDEWTGADVPALVREVDARLRAATVNFPTADAAARVLGAARILAADGSEAPPLDDADTPLLDQVELVRRMERVRETLDTAHASRLESFEGRLRALRAELDRRGIPVNDIAISPGLAPGARFALREGAIIAGAGPLAWWGRLNHWLPLTLALRLGRLTSRSPEDPAMHTMVLGLVLVLVAYAVQTAIVWRLAGAGWAMLYLASLPVAASWDLRFRDRMRRARRRMRAWFAMRRDPSLQPRLAAELRGLREEALALESLALAQPSPAGGRGANPRA